MRRSRLTLVAAFLATTSAHAQLLSLTGAGLGGVTALPGFTPTLYEDFGDSRIANNEGVSKTTSYAITESLGKGYSGWFMPSVNYPILRTSSGAYGVGATTSLNGKERMASTSTAATGNIACAALGTGTDSDGLPYGTAYAAADCNFNVNSTGGSGTGTAYTPISDPANLVNQMYGTNDAGQTGYYTGTDAATTIAVQTKMINAWIAAGKAVLLADETPNGNATNYLESHACAGCTTVTATNGGGFYVADGSTYGDAGVIDDGGNVWTKVASCAGSSLTYTASGAGVYTACTGTLGTATTYLNYVSTKNGIGGPYTTNTHKKGLSAWLASNSSSFTNTNTTYTGNGALALGNYLYSFDSYGALNAGSDVAYNGSLIDGLHPTIDGAIRVSKAYKTAFNAAFPALAGTSTGHAPVYNNEYVCRGTGAAKTFGSATCTGGTAPGAWGTYMTGSYCPGTTVGGIALLDNGIPFAKSDGAGNFNTNGTTAPDGSVTGTYSCSTGVWTVTTATAPTNAHQIVVAFDATNVLANPLMDTTAPCPTSCPTLPSGMTGTAPPYSWTETLTGGTGLTVTQSQATCTDSAGTWPCLKQVISGVATGAGNLAIQGTISNFSAYASPGNILRGGASVGLGTGSNGQLYGVWQNAFKVTLNSSAYTPSYPGAAASTTVLTCTAGGGTATIPFDTEAANDFETLFPGNLSLGGTAIMLPLVTPGCDTTGQTFTSQSVTDTISWNAGPVSLTAYEFRAQVRVRTN